MKLLFEFIAGLFCIGIIFFIVCACNLAKHCDEVEEEYENKNI